MKINNINIPPVNPYRANQIKAEQTKEQTKIGHDKLEISSKAKQLSEVSGFAAERKSRVQELKSQIESGQYEVKHDKLAENMIKFFN